MDSGMYTDWATFVGTATFDEETIHDNGLVFGDMVVATGVHTGQRLDRELYLENYKGILAYGKEEIHVNGGPWVLRILGRDLEIKAMRAGEMRITGWVDRLELL